MKYVSTAVLLVLATFLKETSANILRCTSVQDIFSALNSVQAGDEIVIAPGLYLADGLAISGTGAHFASYVDGTEQSPIVMRSEDPSNPATLSGANAGSLTCIRIFGAHWTVKGLIVTNAQKGIVFDNAPYGQVINCTVHGVGYEAIHWRDGSDYGLIESCRIYNTGITSPGYGEAIYIGTDKGSWGNYDKDVTYITIRNCNIGPGIAAEAFDIKEGTEEIVVEYNTIDATGISNANSADSFIDLKGIRSYIRYNNFFRNGETKLTKGIAVIDRSVALSSYEHVIHDNYFSLDADGTDIPMVHAVQATSDVFAWDNVRFPVTGNKYSTNVNDFCCPPWYTPPNDGTCFAPFAFSVKSITNTSASLSWIGGIGSIWYTISFERVGSGMVEEITHLGAENYTLTSLEVDTVYEVQVQAICQNDTSKFSTEVAFRTLSNNVDINIPNRPDGAIVIYDDSIAFGWKEYSFTGIYNFAHQASSIQGQYSIEAIIGKYGGLLLKHDGLISSSFANLVFWIRDDNAYGPGSPDLKLEVNSVERIFKIESPGWNFMMVSIEEYSITRIMLQNLSPNSRAIYVDAIELWPEITDVTNAPQSTIPPTPAVTESAPPSSAPTPSGIPPHTGPTLSLVGDTTIEMIYDDSLTSKWNEYSFKGSYDFSSTNEVYEGGTSIRADFNAWGAVNIKSSTGIPTNGLNTLQFYVKPQNDVTIRVKVNGKQYNISPPINVWTSVVLPLSFFESPSNIDAITFQNGSSQQQTVYFDLIKIT